MSDHTPDASSASILSQLMSVIEQRKANPTAHSYTATLLAAGVEKIGEKILEEAGEVVDAARLTDSDAGRQHLIHEAADLIYHLFVMMGYRGITLLEVEAELASRFGTSGLDEKAARQQHNESTS